MKWKDIFFFYKKDKIAIILLSCIGFIIGGSYIVYPHLKSKAEPNKRLNEFAEFQKELTPIYPTRSDVQHTRDSSSILSQRSNKLLQGQRIDLNTANEKALRRVPGIGRTFATRIIEYRSALGGYTRIDQLFEIQGVTDKKFERINNFFYLEKQHRKYSIEKLIQSKHPYLNEKQISSLTQYLNKGERISSTEELLQVEHFTPRDIDKIKEYIDFQH